MLHELMDTVRTAGPRQVNIAAALRELPRSSPGSAASRGPETSLGQPRLARPGTVSRPPARRRRPAGPPR